MTMTVTNLGSGSSGNALLVDADDAVLLVDCGLGPRALATRLAAAGRRLNELTAVLLTHEHVDHIRALPNLVKADVWTLATPGTAAALAVPHRRRELLSTAQRLRIGTLSVTALAVMHDAAEPCGYLIEGSDAAIVVVTDLGCTDPTLVDPIATADLVVLEANHDEQMLRRGPYPPHLKRRVASRTGHLSNRDCGLLLATACTANDKPTTIWLAHLSQTNNNPKLAVQTVQGELARRGNLSPVTAMRRFGDDQQWRSTEPVSLVTNPVQLGLL